MKLHSFTLTALLLGFFVITVSHGDRSTSSTVYAQDTTTTPLATQTATAVSTASAPAAPHAGEWQADAGPTLSFVFVVNADGTGIKEATFRFAEFQCTPNSQSGSVTKKWEKEIAIKAGAVSFDLDISGLPATPALSPVPNKQNLTITGKFSPDGKSASGTWAATLNGMPCSPISNGTWKASQALTTPAITATPKPFVISDRAFEADYKGDCKTNVTIIEVDGTSFSVGEGSIVFVVDDEPYLFCHKAKHTWIGTLTYMGYTFASNEDDPLQFMVDVSRGYVYIGGKGTVKFPNGTIVALPQ